MSEDIESLFIYEDRFDDYSVIHLFRLLSLPSSFSSACCFHAMVSI